LKNVIYGKFWSKIAIVGPSGTGKSTIASLLLRFTILIQVKYDGKNIYDFELENRGIYSSPGCNLFGGTIKENIAYGKPDRGRNFSCKTS
jgi:ABC-type multidrug transport system fused ATPase/permease subunit